MSENAIKKSDKTLLLAAVSIILLLGAYLTYTIVPVSELANGIDHSGMDAVYVLTLSPVLAFLSLIMLALTLFINKGYLLDLLDNRIVFAGFGTAAAMTVISIVFSIIFVASQYDLGFTAPIDGTVYEAYSRYISANVCIEAIALAALTLRMKGISFIKK